jgi:hypothetical protein
VTRTLRIVPRQLSGRRNVELIDEADHVALVNQPPQFRMRRWLMPAALGMPAVPKV